MLNNFAGCLVFVLQEEGGFVDNPHDPGGATMEGITLATYRDFMHSQSLTANDLRNISAQTVATIYNQNYWAVNSCDKLQSGVDLMVFDMDVNAGDSRSAKLLQATVGVSADGQIGPMSLAAANKFSATTLINALAVHQESYYRSLPTFKYFGNGWINRIHARHAKALTMVTNKMAVRLTAEDKTDYIENIKPL